MPDATISGIEFEIRGSANAAASSLDKLSSSLAKIKSATAGGLGIAKIASELRSLNKAIDEVDIAKVGLFAASMKALGRIRISPRFSKGLEEMRDALKGISGARIEQFQNAMTSLATVANQPDAAQAFGTIKQYLQDIANIDFSNVKSAADAIAKIQSVATQNKPVKEAAKEIKNVGKAAEKADSPLKGFLSSLKRIAFYRILRSIIKSITQAFQEGLKNAYEFSKMTGDKAGLANALDTLATKSLTMKNQLGAAFGGLLTAITPIVVQIIGLVTKLAEAISRLFAMLGGNSTYLRAKDVWTEWGEAAAGAGGAAKKALEYLAPFDELNVLPDPKSGGGGGSAAANIGDMFEYADVGEGGGFLDLLADWNTKIAEFFENTDWTGLADKAWQGLKNAFSDTGKASEVIRSLFEALGAAIGAVSAFVGEFCLNIVNEVFAKLKSNLVDYNGDGRISIAEFLGAAFVTSLEISQEIENWIKTNIADPLMDGFAKAIGMEDKDELIDAIVNFGIDIANAFIRNVLNPLKELWNEFADWVYEKTGGWVDWRVEMTAEITHVDSSKLKADQLKLKMMAALATVLDNIPDSKKKVDTTANFTDRSRSDTFKKKWQKFDAEAHFTTRSRSDTFKTKWQKFDAEAHFNTRSRSDDFKKKWQKFNAEAHFTTRSRSDDFKKKWQTFDSEAYFKTRKTGDDFSTVFDSEANFIAREIGSGLSTVFDSEANFKSRVLDKGFSTQFDSKANFNSRKNNLTSDQTTFGSTADFKSRLVNISTAFDSSAKINGYTIDNNVKYNDYLYVGAVLDIKGQANTPTVSVNANYKTRLAKGGVFSGGMWHDIPQYAGGTTRAHGSLFMAGEAGPEVVGHIGGRTEVLNRSQLAATMYASIRSAMSGVGVRVSAPSSDSYNENEDAVYRAIVRAINDTGIDGDIELDGDVLYRKMVQYNNKNTRLTGVNAMA